MLLLFVSAELVFAGGPAEFPIAPQTPGQHTFPFVPEGSVSIENLHGNVRVYSVGGRSLVLSVDGLRQSEEAANLRVWEPRSGKFVIQVAYSKTEEGSQPETHLAVGVPRSLLHLKVRSTGGNISIEHLSNVPQRLLIATTEEGSVNVRNSVVGGLIVQGVIIRADESCREKLVGNDAESRGLYERRFDFDQEGWPEQLP